MECLGCFYISMNTKHYVLVSEDCSPNVCARCQCTILLTPPMLSRRWIRLRNPRYYPSYHTLTSQQNRSLTHTNHTLAALKFIIVPNYYLLDGIISRGMKASRKALGEFQGTHQKTVKTCHSKISKVLARILGSQD